MKKYKLVIWMIPVVVILYLVISFFDFSYNYHGITLENIACRIPKRMWSMDDDNNYS